MGVKTRLFIQYEGLSCFECASSCLLKLPLTMEERREVFQFQEPSLVLFQVLLLRPNGTNPNWLPLLEERREVFQFQEQLALSQDLLLRLNGINKTLLKLPLIMEERREVFQFQEQLALFQDQLLRLNGINKTLLKLPLIMEE